MYWNTPNIFMSSSGLEKKKKQANKRNVSLIAQEAREPSHYFENWWIKREIQIFILTFLYKLYLIQRVVERKSLFVELSQVICEEGTTDLGLPFCNLCWNKRSRDDHGWLLTGQRWVSTFLMKVHNPTYESSQGDLKICEEQKSTFKDTSGV